MGHNIFVLNIYCCIGLHIQISTLNDKTGFKKAKFRYVGMRNVKYNVCAMFVQCLCKIWYFLFNGTAYRALTQNLKQMLFVG